MQDVKSSRTTFINRTQQCFAVKSGVDGILDLARSTFCRVTEQVHELVDKYKTDYGMDALKVHSVASTAQHSTAQHSTAQHSTAQHSTAQHSTAQHSTAHATALRLHLLGHLCSLSGAGMGKLSAPSAALPILHCTDLFSAHQC